MKTSRGMKVFWTIIFVGIPVILLSFGVLIYWSNIVKDLVLAGKEIPDFYDSVKIVSVITSTVAIFGTTGGALIARYLTREATGNLRRVNTIDNPGGRNEVNTQ